jgi:mycothiol synthase
MSGLTIRRATTDADLEAWTRVRRIVVPDEPSSTIEQMRSMAAEPDRVFVLAELDGETVGSGVASDSNLADGFAMPRILPEHRRHGFGSAVLEALLDHHVAFGRRTVSSRAEDDAALAFATHHRFVEFDRQIEQVRTILPVEPEPPPYPGVEFTTVAADPGLLERAYSLAAMQGYADMALVTGPAQVPLDEWLRDEATLPGGSIVAIADGEIVGWAGLSAWNDDDTRAENGLTVVDRTWRGKGLGTALKRRQLAWAAAHGIREIVTWTQDANDAMRHVNTSLGYATRTISRTVRRDLP